MTEKRMQEYFSYRWFALPVRIRKFWKDGHKLTKILKIWRSQYDKYGKK